MEESKQNEQVTEEDVQDAKKEEAKQYIITLIKKPWVFASIIIVLVAIIIAIASSISSSSSIKLNEEQQIAYDLVTTYYYEILDDYGLESAESFKVKKCEVYSYEDLGLSCFGGWFFLELNNTYESYYSMQLTSTGDSDFLQQAPQWAGQDWGFEPSVSTRALNNKLEQFVEEEKKFGENERIAYNLVVWNCYEMFAYDDFAVVNLEVLEAKAETIAEQQIDYCWLRCKITLESGQTKERYYYIIERYNNGSNVYVAEENEYSTWTFDKNLHIDKLNEKLIGHIWYDWH